MGSYLRLHLLVPFHVQPTSPIYHMTVKMWEGYKIFRAPGFLKAEEVGGVFAGA